LQNLTNNNERSQDYIPALLEWFVDLFDLVNIAMRAHCRPLIGNGTTIIWITGYAGALKQQPTNKRPVQST
jgi:hypothetical protein